MDVFIIATINVLVVTFEHLDLKLAAIGIIATIESIKKR
jgi:hypothetical protein